MSDAMKPGVADHDRRAGDKAERRKSVAPAAGVCTTFDGNALRQRAERWVCPGFFFDTEIRWVDFPRNG
jgi:hypothetical protein